MNSNEVAARFHVNPSIARHWAAKNGVGRKMTGGIFAFDWTEDDCRRFMDHPKPGRRRRAKDDI
jgi:hypothetical protein